MTIIKMLKAGCLLLRITYGHDFAVAYLNEALNESLKGNCVFAPLLLLNNISFAARKIWIEKSCFLSIIPKEDHFFDEMVYFLF